MARLRGIAGALIVILLTMTGGVFAADFFLGGEFTLSYSGSPATDASSVHWWEFQAFQRKNFGPGQAYLAMTATPNNVLAVRGFGYTYHLKNGLSISASNDANGELLADSRVITAGYDWQDPFDSINMNHRMFVRKTALKLSGTVAPGITGSVTFNPDQLLIKAVYNARDFKVGGGWTNTREGYADSASKRPVYALYGEAKLTPSLQLYAEYIDGNRYYWEAAFREGPYKLTAKHGNISYQKAGRPSYEAEVLDTSVEYALGHGRSVTGGIGYYLSDYPGFAKVYAGFTVDRFNVYLSRHLYYKETVLGARYNIDGTNELAFDYNVEDRTWNLRLYVNLW